MPDADLLSAFIEIYKSNWQKLSSVLEMIWASRFAVVGGKLVELWLSWDQLGMMQQLRLVPPAADGQNVI